MKKHCSKLISGCSAPSNTERKWRIQRERKKKQIAFRNEKQPYQNRPMVGVLSCPSLILLTAARVEWWNFLLSGGKIHTSTFCMDLFCIPTDTCESTAPQPPLHSHPWAVPAVSPGTSGQYASACEYTLALERALNLQQDRSQQQCWASQVAARRHLCLLGRAAPSTACCFPIHPRLTLQAGKVANPGKHSRFALCHSVALLCKTHLGLPQSTCSLQPCPKQK